MSNLATRLAAITARGGAVESFSAYETAFPHENLRRRWEELTQIEQAQWRAAARVHPGPLFVQALTLAVEALERVSKVDHVGKDAGFSACNEIAEQALAALDALTTE